jgi:hypothetical protein
MSIVLFEGPSGTSALYVEGVLKKRGPHAEVMDCLHRFTNVEVYHDDCFDMGGRSDIDKNGGRVNRGYPWPAQTVEEALNFRKTRVKNQIKANQLRREADDLLLEATKLENPGKRIVTPQREWPGVLVGRLGQCQIASPHPLGTLNS